MTYYEILIKIDSNRLHLHYREAIIIFNGDKMTKKVLKTLSLFLGILLLAFVVYNYVTSVGTIENIPQKAETSIPIEPKPREVNLVAFGDLMVHQRQIYGAETEDGYDFKPSFRYLKDMYIKPADLAMINLETTLTDGENGYTSYPTFSSPSELAYDLNQLGFELASTANNHSYDKGLKGIDDTLDFLADAEIATVGTSKQGRPEPKILERNHIKIGFSSYTYGLNGFETSLENSERPEAVNLINLEQMEKDVKNLKEKGADFIIFYLHWGEEYQRQFNKSQQDLFYKLANVGVDLILGSHPHVIQEMEQIEVDGKTHTVIYSMGNFISTQRRHLLGQPYSETGLMVQFTLEKDPKGDTRLKSLKNYPLWVDYYMDDTGHNIDIIPVEAALMDEIKIDRIEEIRPQLEEALGFFEEMY